MEVGARAGRGPISDIEGGGVEGKGWERGMYSEVQHIMGNGHMGNPVNRLTNTSKKHYLPTTSLAGGNEYEQVEITHPRKHVQIP